MSSEATNSIRQAERAGFYLGATAVMAKLQRRRVLEIFPCPAERWPGQVVFARDLLSPWDKRRGKLGQLAEQNRVEEAVLVHISGAVAVDLLDNGPSIFEHDPSVQQAHHLLIDMDWLKSEAKAHLQWLRHRATKLLAHPMTWRSVVALAEASMSQHRLGEKQIRSAIDTAKQRKRVGGKEHFVLINSDSSLPDLDTVPAKKDKICKPLPPVQNRKTHDGIVTEEVVRKVRAEMRDPASLQHIVTRLRQVEPYLWAAIENEMKHFSPLAETAGINPLELVAPAVLRCGLLVAELLNQGHSALWETAETI